LSYLQQYDISATGFFQQLDRFVPRITWATALPSLLIVVSRRRHRLPRWCILPSSILVAGLLTLRLRISHWTRLP